MRKVILALALLPIGVVNYSAHANTIDEQGKLLDQMERSISHVERKETPAFTVLREGIVPQKMNQLSSDEPEFLIHHIELSQVPSELNFLQTMVANK